MSARNTRVEGPRSPQSRETPTARLRVGSTRWTGLRTLAHLTLLGVVVLALATACENKEDTEPTEESEEAAEEAATPASLDEVDYDAHAKTLSATLLNAAASRDRALADVAEILFGIERPRGEPGTKFLVQNCPQLTEGECNEIKPEMVYFAVLEPTLRKLGEAASAQGNEKAAGALGGWADQVAGMLEKGYAYSVPVAKEPLHDLTGDPVLVPRSTDGERVDLDILVGGQVTRTIEDVLAEESEARQAFFDTLEKGDLFALVGLQPPEGKKIAPQTDTPLRILIPSDTEAGAAIAFLRRANASHGAQKMKLVVRSEAYDSLAGLELNLVKASMLGSDYGVRLDSDQVTWRHELEEDEDADVEHVAWESIDRLGEIAQGPPGQIVVYVEIRPELSGQQVADALSALRTRCGDQALCQSMQLALAMKPTKSE